MLFIICILTFEVFYSFKTQNHFYSYGVEFIHLFYVFEFWVILKKAFSTWSFKKDFKFVILFTMFKYLTHLEFILE